MYTKADEIRKRELIEQVENETYRNVLYDKLQTMYRFALSSRCKHRLLGEYFSDEGEVCGDKCDSCLKEETAQVDITKEAQMFLSAIYRTGERFGQNHIIEILRGSRAANILKFGHDKLSVYGIGEMRNRDEWGMIADRLFETEAIAIGAHRALKLLPFAAKILRGEATLQIDADLLGQKRRLRPVTKTMPQDKTFSALRTLRMELASSHNVPAYIVFNDKTLHELSRALPQSREEMLQISGIGEVKYERYGEAFLKLCRELAQQEEKQI